MGGMNDPTSLPSNKAADARDAMHALIVARGIPIREDEPEFAAAVAELAWLIADAMAVARSGRSVPPSNRPSSRPPRRPR